MLVRDFMTYNPAFVYSDSIILDAAKKMKDLDTGFIPVTDKKTDTIVGTLTDRDIVINAIANDKDTKTEVSEAMDRGVYYCFETDSVEKAEEMMRNKQIRRLIVLDEGKDLLGVISLGDIAANDTNEQLTGRTLKSISKP